MLKVVFYKEHYVGKVDLKKEMYYKLYDMEYYSPEEVQKEVDSVVSSDDNVDYYDCLEVTSAVCL